MSDTKALIERLRNATVRYGNETQDQAAIRRNKAIAEAAATIARLEAERDAARREAMEECARICDGIARQYSSDGAGHAAERTGNAIRAAMKGEP